MRSPRGSVLVVSVWTVGLLAGLTVAQASRVGLQTRLAGRWLEGAQAAALAQSGVAWAQGVLAADPTLEWDATSEAWARPEQWGAGFQSEEGGWAVRDDPEAPGIVRMRVRDAQGTVLLNAATPDILTRLPALAKAELPGFADAVAQAVATGPDGQPRPLVHLEELVVRAGVPPESVAALAAVARTWGPKPVNLNTVAPATLAALGLDAQAAELFCAKRDALAATAPVFTKLPDDVLPFLKDQLGYDADAAPYQQMESLMTQGWADVRSSVFTIEVEAATRAHGVRRTVTAVVARTAPSGIQVLRWEEGMADAA